MNSVALFPDTTTVYTVYQQGSISGGGTGTDSFTLTIVNPCKASTFSWSFTMQSSYTYNVMDTGFSVTFPSLIGSYS